MIKCLILLDGFIKKNIKKFDIKNHEQNYIKIMTPFSLKI